MTPDEMRLALWDKKRKLSGEMSHGTAREPSLEELQSLNPVKYGEQALEEPLLSPDMLIGTGIPTKIAKAASKFVAPTANRMLESYMVRSGMRPSIIKDTEGLMGASGVITKVMREANLAKFLAPSAEKRRMYHVSKEPNITEFKSRHQMTEDSHDRDAVFLSPKPEFTNSFARGEGTTTYPVYAQIEKPFDFDNPEHLNKVKETYLDMYHNPDSDLYDHYMLPSERSMAVHTFNKRVDGLPSDESNWDSIENQDFQDVLKDLGFDSFYTRERGTKNLGVYDGSRIKSAIGNRGTYDINESDMSKADGGAINKHERKANLDKFLEGSVAPKLYHGTQVRPESPHGIGDIHKFDRQFTTKFRNPSIDTMGSWFSTNPGKGGAEMYSGAREGSAIYPVHASIKNPFYTTFQKMAKHAREHHNGVDDGRMIGKPEVDAYRKWLISRGMDGVVIKHDKSAPGGNEFKDQDAWIALHPHQVKSATGNRGTYDPKEDDMSKADGGAINAEPLGEDTVKWTSPLADTVNSHKLGSMSGEQWMSWLHANAPRNAKKEAHASGTFDWLPQQANASKEAIVKHMKANAPRIKVKKFENNPKPGMQARFEELRNEGEVRRLTSSERDEIVELTQKLEDTPKTKFDEHVMPDGTQSNYREMTLSHSNPTGGDYIVPGAHTYGDDDADINRILHMRMNDRNISHPAFTANRHPSTKALNIEELQSDWAQRGRSDGFRKPVPKDVLTELDALDRQGSLSADDWHRRRELQEKKIRARGLPSGPYVQNTEDWTKLGLHNAIKEAAEKGHHAVTWTNGDEQAKRWGNEGLKHYYDTVMPSVANDILKRMGVKERVGKFNLGTGSDHHGFHMTPEIVAHIKKHGLPRFASGGDISKLKAYMLREQGTHGARRVERAADEVPNLENMYELQALKRAFGDDKTSAVMSIHPSDFEKYSTPLSSSGTPRHEIDEHVKYLRSVGKFSDVPYLNLHKPDIGEPIIPGHEAILKSRRTPQIVGHQGRHRSRAFTDNGEKSSLVRVSPMWDLKKHLKSKTHEEYLDALHKEMAKTDHMVRPETYEIDGADQHRSPIALPKMFAKGGRSVEALDRESDEVPIEKRVRDALDKIHLNASGGKDAYGTGAGGRLAVDFPLSKSVTLSPYLEGSAYKPKDQNTSSQISGAGLSLTKRFAEGGKAKFLEPSAEKDRWYHGTNRNIRSFKGINRHGHLGKPDRPNIHFVSKSPDVANQFAMRGHQHPQFGEPIELNDKDYMEGMDHRSGANVMPVHVQVKNPFDIENPKHLEAIENHLGEMSHGLRHAHEDAKDQRENYDALEHPHIQRAIKDMGHDSFYTYELGHKNLGIYDPRKIKSAIGNRGTYDTNEHDITKSKGGLAHAFAEGGPVDIPKNIWNEFVKVKNVEKDNANEGRDNRFQKMRNTKSFKRLNNAIRAHIGDNDRQQLEYHWKLQDHYNKEHGE